MTLALELTPIEQPHGDLIGAIDHMIVGRM